MKNDHAAKTDLNELKSNLGELKVDMKAVKSDVGALKVDMKAVKSDVGALKVDMKAVKSDVGGLKVDMKAVKVEMKDMREEFGDKFIDFSMKMEQNSLELKEEMNRKFDTVIIALDGIAGIISDNRVEKAAAESTFRRHEAKLDEHEIRIGNLERNEV